MCGACRNIQSYSCNVSIEGECFCQSIESQYSNRIGFLLQCASPGSWISHVKVSTLLCMCTVGYSYLTQLVFSSIPVISFEQGDLLRIKSDFLVFPNKPMTIKVKNDIKFYKQDLYFCFKDPYTKSVLFVKYIDRIIFLLFELSAPFLRMDYSRQ